MTACITWLAVYDGSAPGARNPIKLPSSFVTLSKLGVNFLNIQKRMHCALLVTLSNKCAM